MIYFRAGYIPDHYTTDKVGNKLHVSEKKNTFLYNSLLLNFLHSILIEGKLGCFKF